MKNMGLCLYISTGIKSYFLWSVEIKKFLYQNKGFAPINPKITQTSHIFVSKNAFLTLKTCFFWD